MSCNTKFLNKSVQQFPIPLPIHVPYTNYYNLSSKRADDFTLYTSQKNNDVWRRSCPNAMKFRTQRHLDRTFKWLKFVSDEWIARTPAHRNCTYSRSHIGLILNMMVKISVAFRLRIFYVGCNSASVKDSCTLQTDVRVERDSPQLSTR